jgi:peptidoglycan/LPS O-acetylase OafA/YrhL
MSFRSDINALRAVAILGVLIFHFNKAWLPGGFAGVDVFFVISGYLMTGIIFGKLLTGKITIWEFYLARANRIIPALLVLCLSLLVWGWFCITPVDYKAVAKHVAASVTFLSNVVYYREINYFDAASAEKWLLHTWSLSVEWQFYIVYPALLLAMRRFVPWAYIPPIIGAALCISFALSGWAAYAKAQLAFYMLPFRAWEMLLGGVVFLYPLKLSQPIRVAGLGLGVFGILITYVFYTEELAWPGIYALLPVLSAGLIIAVNAQSTWLNGQFLQKIGTWSYSIYLWHWPIVVIGVYFWLPHWWLAVGIPLSILMGFLSYQFVEKMHFSRACRGVLNLLYRPAVIAAVPVLLLSILLYINKGFPRHYAEKVVLSNSEKLNFNPLKCMQNQDATKEFLHCIAGERTRDLPAFVLVGDSHANAFSSAVFNALDEKAWGINFVRAGCPYIENQKNRNADNNKECINDNQNRKAVILDEFKNVPVVWGARLAASLFGQSDPRRVQRGDKFPSIYFDQEYEVYSDKLLVELENNLTITACELTQNGRRLGLVGSIPEMGVNVPDYLSRKMLFTDQYADVKITLTQHLARTQVIDEMLMRVAKQCNAVFLDPKKYLCDGHFCYGSFEGRPFYYDGDHLSEYGNQKLIPLFREFLRPSHSSVLIQ